MVRAPARLHSKAVEQTMSKTIYDGYDPDEYNHNPSSNNGNTHHVFRWAAGIAAGTATVAGALFGLGRVSPGQINSAVVAGQCQSNSQAKLCAEIGIQNGKIDGVAQFNSVNSKQTPMKIVSMRLTQNGSTLAQKSSTGLMQTGQRLTTQSKCPPANAVIKLNVQGKTLNDGRWQPINVKTSTVSDGSCQVPVDYIGHVPVIRANGAPGVRTGSGIFDDIDNGLHRVGRTAGEVGDDIGHGISKSAGEVGHGLGEVGHDVGKSVHNMGEEGGHGGFGGGEGEGGGFGGGHGGENFRLNGLSLGRELSW
jgi:hypothetical protein